MGDPDSVRVLLGKDGDVNARTASGGAPLELAIRERQPDDPRMRADQAIMRLLLDAGADVHLRGKDGNRALHTAAWSNRADLAALLLEHGADVDVRNDSGTTPLHYAAAAGHTEVVELLLTKGADVNAKKNDRRTALIDVYGNEPMKALLRRHGARD
jgi:ankyrin repeat protein